MFDDFDAESLEEWAQCSRTADALAEVTGLSVVDLLNKIKSDPKMGIDSATIPDRVKKFGSAMKWGPAVADSITVVRDGQQLSVEVLKAVAGDILILSKGCVIPFNCVMLQGAEGGGETKCYEGDVTGEAGLICKSVDRDILLLGCTVLSEGSGVRALVIGVKAPLAYAEFMVE